MKLTFRLLIMLVLAAVLLSACSVGGRNALIGRWLPEKSAEGQAPAIQEYTTNGKYRQDVNSGLVLEATYQFEDDSVYVLIMPEGLGIATRVKFEVTGDKLTLTPYDEQTKTWSKTTSTLTRVK